MTPKIPLANYESERNAYLRLFDPTCGERIVLYHGASGIGKTTLLAHCSQLTPEHVIHVPIQLRGSAVSVSEIFYRVGRTLGWKNLRNFTQSVADAQSSPVFKIDRNWLIGIKNNINVALHIENPEMREHRRVALTDAWFDDVVDLKKTLLLLFDTYEHATSEVKEWLCGPFLARIAQVKTIRIVVAGQEIPEYNNIEWGHCCVAQKLYGVPEAYHWLPIVEALGRQIPVDPPLVWLAGICHALKGDPKQIRDVIDALPLKDS